MSIKDNSNKESHNSDPRGYYQYEILFNGKVKYFFGTSEDIDESKITVRKITQREPSIGKPVRIQENKN